MVNRGLTISTKIGSNLGICSNSGGFSATACLRRFFDFFALCDDAGGGCRRSDELELSSDDRVEDDAMCLGSGEEGKCFAGKLGSGGTSSLFRLFMDKSDLILCAMNERLTAMSG